jgi:hypothetical protein
MSNRVSRPLAGVAAAGVLALLVPGSPVHPERWGIGSGRYDGRTAGEWSARLGDPDPVLRREAVNALGAMPADAPDTVPQLARALGADSDPSVRAAAALALSKLTPHSAPAVEALTAALRDPSLAVRYQAAVALMKLGPAAKPAVPALLAVFDDPDNRVYPAGLTATVQDIAAAALAKITPGSADAVPTLVDALAAADTWGEKRSAAAALGAIGPPAAPAVPLLRRLLDDPNPDVRLAAVGALAKLGVADAEECPPTDPPAPPGLELPDADRRYLWKVENAGNILVKVGFARLADALKANDLRDPMVTRSASPFAVAEKRTDAGATPTPLTRDAFADRLLALRARFASAPPKVAVSMMALTPVKYGELDGPWRGTAQLRMAGESAPGAPAEVVVYLKYDIPRPTGEALNNPGWLRAAGITQVNTAGSPGYLFADVTNGRGLDPAWLHDNWTAGAEFHPVTGGVYVTDFDRDGWLDVLITDVNGVRLYRGSPGGQVRDVTSRVGLPTTTNGRMAAAWVDLDGDGWDDLLLAGRVYRNEGGQRFTDHTLNCNLRVPADAVGVVVADYDRDGQLDVYLTRPGRPGGGSWLSGKAAGSKGNVLLRNLGNWRFQDVTAAAGAGGGQKSTFTAAWLDADDDGWPDLHVINEFGDGVLLANNRDGTFREVLMSDRPADYGSMGLAVGDVDGDGRIDIYPANMYSKAGTRVIGNLRPDSFPPDVMEKLRRFVAGSQLHLNKGGLKFEQAGPQAGVAAVGWAYGAALADLDGDGWLDVYGTAGFVSRDRTEPDG